LAAGNEAIVGGSHLHDILKGGIEQEQGTDSSMPPALGHSEPRRGISPLRVRG
jgi:hypothetical protein